MKVLVTGGGGFLGSGIVRRLLQRGDHVRSLTRRHYPALANLQVEQIRGDIADAAVVKKAAAGCDLVFHVAAKAGVWGKSDDYEQANVVGTENVIRACRDQGIAKLVYTSSPSVVFDGYDQEGIDETEPYPDKYLAHYPRTKAIAERSVRDANGPGLATVSLRPHLIWGPGDNHLVPRIISRAKAGKLKLVGRTPKRVDSVYIDDAVNAHMLAADRLCPDSDIAGQVYFITQGEPIFMPDLINKILAAGKQRPVSRTVSAAVAYAAGALLEAAFSITRRESEPIMTRFLARQLSTAHWFDLRAARRDLGYEPKVSIDDGMSRLADWLAQRSAG